MTKTAGKICSSCKRQITSIPRSTSFKCPQCAKTEIVRCGRCRELATLYTCNQCGFEGPN
ncbi:MAG TPA: zinc finger domain-containing protein [Candidatus Nanoarchaeia archaeon]|nr:zinc finger domain-containing protein [Candidatus Nanoarchaeia archaeon]